MPFLMMMKSTNWGSALARATQRIALNIKPLNLPNSQLQWQVEQWVEWQPEQLLEGADDTVFPPEEKPKADMSLRGESVPHLGQTMALRSTETRTNSSNLFSHLVHWNS